MKSKLCARSTSQGKSVEHQGMSEQIKSLSALLLHLSPHFPPSLSLKHPPFLSLLRLSKAISFHLSSPAPCLPLVSPLAPLSSPLSAGPKMEWLSRTELTVN